MPQQTLPFDTRRADASDAEGIAMAHRDSIRSIGPRFYSDHIVDAWAEGLTGELYTQAMEGGEVFFIAVAQVDGVSVVLGFASDYPRGGSRHGTSVYVTGSSARRGVGTALLRLAEAEAIARGATSVHIEASLAGVHFYRANGFVEVGRGQTHLMSGRPIDCVFMEKTLA
jgi:GNAT superfamily N-acetyltransferase